MILRAVGTDCLSEEDRVDLCDWYRFHGVDPNTIPENHELYFDPQRLEWVVERYVIQGRALSFDLDLPRYRYSFAEKIPFPEIGEAGVTR